MKLRADPDAPAGATQIDRLRSPGRRRHANNMDSEGISAATRADIIAAATIEFVAHGFQGASINAIAARTRTSKRMLYYHFGSKRAIYMAVLESSYDRVGRIVLNEDLDSLAPMDALRRYAEHAFEVHQANEDFVRLVIAENLNNAETLRESSAVRARTSVNIDVLNSIVARGRAEAAFRDDFDVRDLYVAITAPSFYSVSNRATLFVTMGTNMSEQAEIARRRRLIGEIACRFARAT